MTDAIRTHEVTLEAIKFVAMQYVTQNAQIDSALEWASEEIALRMIYRVYGQRLDEQVVRHPADWWQAFRARWFPRWWLTRHPVRERAHRMRLYALYPELPVQRQRTSLHITVDEVDAPDPR